MKKGFSLIEIIQTVVLLGIIAGLSISFFKNNSNDEKLYNQTVKLLEAAEKEVSRQMCADERIVCNNALVEEEKRCDATNKATGFTTTAIDGYCCYNTSSGTCKDITGVERVTLDPKKEGVQCCYPPMCSTTSKGVTTYKATTQKMSDLVCPNGTPNYAYNSRKSIKFADGSEYEVSASGNVTELCVRLHETINHKPQGTNQAEDLRYTCKLATHNCFTPTSKNCSGVTVNNVNLILPNGARLYGLSQNFSSGKLNVFIKYDRIEQVRTAVLSDTDPDMINTKMYTFENPKK